VDTNWPTSVKLHTNSVPSASCHQRYRNDSRAKFWVVGTLMSFDAGCSNFCRVKDFLGKECSFITVLRREMENNMATTRQVLGLWEWQLLNHCNLVHCVAMKSPKWVYLDLVVVKACLCMFLLELVTI
jgi:hypothetical protein